MLTHEQNELLVRVEGDAPMGRLMREHYWIPACVSSQLIADGAPLRVRLLGKNYVAFRAIDGRVGFFDERCPHRGTSLVFARNEDCALRCIFHGWKIDVSGNVVEVPTQAPNAQAFAAKIRVNRYPIHEGGGIVWAWLGERAAPKFPELAFTNLPDARVWMTITKVDCNWLQGVEGTIDSAHIGTLHAAYMTSAKDDGNPNSYALDVLAPRYEVEPKPYGLDATALRPLPDGRVFVRTTCYVMPFISLTPFTDDIPGVAFIASPIDDTHYNLFYGIWSPGKDLARDKNGAAAILANARGNLAYDPHNYGRLVASFEENLGQDRAAMKRGHFSGFTDGLLQEDVATQVSMGPIVDRTLDHLSSSDAAIVRARRMLLAALEDMDAGRTPIGAGDNLDFSDVVPTSAVLPADERRRRKKRA